MALYLVKKMPNANKSISKFTVLLGILFLVTVFNTLVFISNADIIPSASMSIMMYSIRDYFIQISFAIALFVYLRLKSVQYIVEVLFMGIVANAAMAIIEILKDPTHRLSMLFPEPSSAGYYYLFIFFLISHYYRKGMEFYISRFFLVIGIAIGSKAQYLLLGIVGLLKYSSPKKMIVFLLVVGSLTYGYKDEILAMKQVEYNRYVVETYLNGGLRNFKEENGIWGTYVTRVSGIEGAVRCLYEHPFGVGTGYGLWFSINMPQTGIDNPETNRVIDEFSATARSNLLDLFLRTGILGLGIYLYIAFWFYKIRKKHYFLFQSFLMLTLASLFIELNPMFMYLSILVSLLEKENQSNKKDLINEKN